eukprot:6528989-Prymnesium_polylepis.1
MGSFGGESLRLDPLRGGGFAGGARGPHLAHVIRNSDHGSCDAAPPRRDKPAPIPITKVVKSGQSSSLICAVKCSPRLRRARLPAPTHSHTAKPKESEIALTDHPPPPPPQ